MSGIARTVFAGATALATRRGRRGQQHRDERTARSRSPFARRSSRTSDPTRQTSPRRHHRTIAVPNRLERGSWRRAPSAASLGQLDVIARRRAREQTTSLLFKRNSAAGSEADARGYHARACGARAPPVVRPRSPSSGSSSIRAWLAVHRRNEQHARPANAVS